ncbi:MAG: hypothetical protein NC548_29005 [Lachnospiraceae bacterium]|nr:hypothetical protein [Lachnospiraceae bacterium]
MMERDVEQEIREAEESLHRLEQQIERVEYDANRDVLKHFDRLHDKLFTFNTVFITGYFALCQINKEFNSLILLLPFCALSVLVYIEHYMKEIARRQTHGLREVNLSIHLKETDKKYNKATLKSLLVILFSVMELLYTMYICIFKF